MRWAWRGQTLTTQSPEPGRLDVRLFGHFKIFRDGAAVPIPQPKAATALKILVLNGGVIHKDKLVEAVWPDDDPAVGRARLRNLLSKIRRTTGAQIRERNSSVLLLDDVRCDLVEFIQLATRALAAIDEPQESARLCIEAQDLWVGPPLEEDRFEPWAQGPRKRAFDLQRRMWTLLPELGRAHRDRAAP